MQLVEAWKGKRQWSSEKRLLSSGKFRGIPPPFFPEMQEIKSPGETAGF